MEQIISKMKTEQGKCRPGMDMLGMDYVFTQPPAYHRTKRQRDSAGIGADKCHMFTTSYVMSSRRFHKHLAQLKQYYECQRLLLTEQKRDHVCLPGPNGKKDTPGSIMVPTPIIHGPWMLRAELRQCEDGILRGL